MSVIASALKHMLAAGMPADAIVAAVAEMEEGLRALLPDATDTRSRAAIRQARYRDNLRNKASQYITDVTPVTESDAEKSRVTGVTPSPAP
ncbi:hypothetical protein, partial [Sphingobium sp. ZW T5_29]|uniref:hypothetical protein n=1 Tax=Sphingobium sp. ZW T5_29 TaxID=3378077 RepID=UPI0038555CA5